MYARAHTRKHARKRSDFSFSCTPTPDLHTGDLIPELTTWYNCACFYTIYDTTEIGSLGQCLPWSRTVNIWHTCIGTCTYTYEHIYIHAYLHTYIRICDVLHGTINGFYSLLKASSLFHRVAAALWKHLLPDITRHVCGMVSTASDSVLWDLVGW